MAGREVGAVVEPVIGVILPVYRAGAQIGTPSESARGSVEDPAAGDGIVLIEPVGAGVVSIDDTAR